ncbi:nucleoside deaminase [Pseudomonas syringae]|uniref:nucleoside deaminase n=1 Tax=Pseudomonas syringae TaxID=317 RepID=UPI0010718026|nr:deaminase [Pseudomonas syringae]
MSTESLLTTPLHALHRELGAKMVPFAGYDMPVQYPAGVMKEHLHTRAQAGLFDVSHMGQIRLSGADAAKALDNYRLPGSTLYVTLEPCSMCAGLIVHSRVARVVYGALEPKAGIVQSQGQFFSQAFLNHRVLFEGGVLGEECGTMLSEFFRMRRAAKDADKGQGNV